MSTDGPSLYGVPRPKTKPKHEIASSTSLAFASQLGTLLAQSRPATTTSARVRPSKSGKDDIFTSHNRGARKRAAADLSTNASSQLHKTNIGSVDTDTLHRSKRKMEEKARLYAAMKRGDYVPPRSSRAGINDEREPLVDFDRKWAEDEAAGKEENYDTSSSSDDGASDEDEIVDFEDEFGRMRKGTTSEAAREERRRRGIALAELQLDEMSARPAMPSNIIYGDAVQTAAFDPDEPIAAQMDELARKRDRSATPPPEVHYDASKEVRSKGVGFYQFSGDKEGREGEMENLRKEREETIRRQKDREEKREARKREIEERRRLVREKRGEKLAKKFLDGF